MSRVVRVALGLSLALASCAEPPSEFRQFAISPEFPTWRQEAIVEAAEAWFERVPEARIPIVIGDDNGLGAIVPAESCSGLHGSTELGGGRPLIRICPGLRAATYATALHEIGHALSRGDNGHLPNGNVMSLTTSYTQELTDADVEFVRAGMNGEPLTSR